MGNIHYTKKQSKTVNLMYIQKKNSLLKGAWQTKMNKVSTFYNEVKHEIKETSWPSAKEMRKNTNAVFTIIILFTLFFYLADSVIVWLLTFI